MFIPVSSPSILGVIIGCSTDGASTNTGKKNGVLARLGVPDATHCVPHTTSLAGEALTSKKKKNGQVSAEGVPIVDKLVAMLKHIAWELWASAKKNQGFHEVQASRGVISF